MRKKWMVAALLCTLLAIGLEVYIVMASVKNNHQVNAYVLSDACEAAKPIQKAQLREIQVSDQTAKSLKTLSAEELIGKEAPVLLPAGKLLTQSDFEGLPKSEAIQTMVIKLNPEQSHIGQLTAGERIDLICYRQGVVTRLEALTVQAVRPVVSSAGEGMAYITLAGDPEQLETLLLSQQEGVVSILKKTAVQNP